MNNTAILAFVDAYDECQAKLRAIDHALIDRMVKVDVRELNWSHVEDLHEVGRRFDEVLAWLRG